MNKDTYIPKPGQELTSFEAWQMEKNGCIMKTRSSVYGKKYERFEEDEAAIKFNNWMQDEADKQLEFTK